MSNYQDEAIVAVEVDEEMERRQQRNAASAMAREIVANERQTVEADPEHHPNQNCYRRRRAGWVTGFILIVVSVCAACLLTTLDLSC